MKEYLHTHTTAQWLLPQQDRVRNSALARVSAGSRSETVNTHKLQWWLMEKFGGSALCDDAGSAVEAEMLQGRPSGPWNPQRRPGAWERDDMSHVLRND